ncbi:MAG TPA: acyltransferase [bacterium]|nr:acyltransferase [bacterium]HQJ66503.1 acyltransferase [bacterium]
MIKRRKRIPVLQLFLIGLWPNFIKKAIYRLKGYRFGKNVQLSFGAVVSGDKVIIDEGVQIGFFVIIQAKEVHIGRFSTIGAFSYLDTEVIDIGEDTRIREQVFVGGLTTTESRLSVGSRCLIMQMCYLNPTFPIVIGDDSALGGNTLLFTHSSWLSVLEGYPANFGSITIGKKVWIPWRTFIASGVSIGDNVIVQPNTLVNENIPANSIAGGRPLRIVPNAIYRPLNQKAKLDKIQSILQEFIVYLNYCEIIANHTIKPDFDEYTVINNGMNRIFLCLDSTIPLTVCPLDVIIYCNATDCHSISFPKTAGMILNVASMTRSGSCDLGEELVRFFSRYGIRFTRID